MNEQDQRKALFWCSLLQPVLFNQVEKAQVHQFLKELAHKEVLFPNGERKTPSLSSLQRKVRIYKKDGFEALARKRRSDRGKPRVHSQEVIDRAIDVKRDQAKRSHVTINKFLQAKHHTTVPKSTLYWHLRRAGATKIKLGVDKKKVRGRWTRDRTHALWLGDFEEGPYVIHDNQVVQTHLSAFIDCHSRKIVEGRYYFRQNLDILIDSLLRAFSTHGAPLGLYLDHAKVYQSRALKSVCYHIDIRHISRARGDPSPGGLIEKFFGTVQSQFEEEVRRGDILTLEKLNRAFSAWLEMSYHKTPSDETKEAPEERFQKGLTVIRHVDLEAVLVYFMKRETRTVHPDFSDVRLMSRFYRVDTRLRTDKVEVRYDPFSAMDTVLIYSREGEYLGKGVEHNREVQDNPPSLPEKRTLKYNYLELLIEEHEKALRAKTKGIDYRRAVTERRWAYLSFVKTFGQLLGRKGGMSAFTTRELELLKRYYNRCPRASKPLLTEAFESAEDKSLLGLLYQLQTIHDRKE